QHSTAQHSTAQHSTAQHSTAQHSTAQHSTAQHSTAQHSTNNPISNGVVNSLLQYKVNNWINAKKEDSQSIESAFLKNIEQNNYLRQPQKEALEVFLWLKFAGNNKSLYDIIKSGLLYDNRLNVEYSIPKQFENKYVATFLYQFSKNNKLEKFATELNKNPEAEKWDKILKDILHNFDYPNYLYSLPMGAGKTYLMACFIYTELYFSTILNDKRFAQNFIIFAPQASKTAILPSLKTIKNFNPEYLFSKDIATRLKNVIHIEILDALSSDRKDKLQGKNPNLEKVNRLNQIKETGLVFITNAEKVVMEKYSDSDIVMTDKNSILYDSQKIEELEKTNELRERLSKLKNFTVVLDEVHHSYAKEKDEKKLRQAVNTLNQHKNINNVIGLSGTPYVDSKIITEEFTLKLKQIQDIVYNYPLNLGIGNFLKIPEIKKADVKESTFIKQSLTDFFRDFDKTYYDGTQSKIAFYCPSIAKLNDEILPVIQEWYVKHRPNKESEIFKFYTNVSKDEEKYKLPKDALATFNNLDKPYCKKRVILLVAIGKEGWDCKSLTAVSLPRKHTTKNFVLQTTCRCLREVKDAKIEKALIYLCPDNYEALDKELQENYKLSIRDLKNEKKQFIDVQVRKPNLGKIKYKQVKKEWKLISCTTETPDENIETFNFDYYKYKYFYQTDITTAGIGGKGIVERENQPLQTREIESTRITNIEDFIYRISDYLYGKYDETELYKQYKTSLEKILKIIDANHDWLLANPKLNLEIILQDIASIFADSKKYKEDFITVDTEIELLEWLTNTPKINIMKSSGEIEVLIPQIENDIKTYQKHPQDIETDYFINENNIDPNDISFNYVPYKMDSIFEKSALVEMLKLSELAGLEVYFNGFKDKELQNFYIETPRGIYTPDFLILKRKENKKYKKGQKGDIEKVLIVETKGKPYYEDFKTKEKFIKGDFLHFNKNFSFHCFVDEDGKNDFSRQLIKFKDLLKIF
ncbi:MAG: DEAD/DEAH box helicase family protein, partial [Elusimicrobiota bacterium]|nr:DEAD/DEAH box helicase family protein [Elusimicrobiota bacterium]